MPVPDLTPHPEGGKFAEVFRSSQRVQTAGDRDRCALTHIYFSLQPGEVSRFHRVTSDEIWNLYRGGVRLYVWGGMGSELESVELSDNSQNYCHVVPAGYWQAAFPLSDGVLVGCSVAPGFEFEDFELIDPHSEEGQYLLSLDAAFEKLILG